MAKTHSLVGTCLTYLIPTTMGKNRREKLSKKHKKSCRKNPSHKEFALCPSSERSRKCLVKIHPFLHEHLLPNPSLRITRKFRLSLRSRPEVVTTVHWQSFQSTSQTRKNRWLEFGKAKTSPQCPLSRTLINAGASRAFQWPSTSET